MPHQPADTLLTVLPKPTTTPKCKQSSLAYDIKAFPRHKFLHKRSKLHHFCF
ncbi:hypothetical protein COLO4_08941 [Corchorus olitorius]|uniref:Uncharacterized protein n=1 Tax=Corchorus olitorius TaxID=93759 RepID=A0A1R3KDW4_9ROSI|nr:hypothetical protein COLO4_08941 [Corchorus olitorius]